MLYAVITVDIQELRLADLRRHIALVSQEVVLFNASVRENIAYGATADASEAEIIRAARAAHAMEFIEAMPVITSYSIHYTKLYEARMISASLASAVAP